MYRFRMNIPEVYRAGQMCGSILSGYRRMPVQKYLPAHVRQACTARCAGMSPKFSRFDAVSKESSS